jgi:surface carbohydrate biosynthesis protein (TIGR04326 family)
MKHEKFISEYCRIINLCHGQLPDQLWFATWMSSKSPYFNFPHNFEKFWLSGKIPQRQTPYAKIKIAFRQFITLCSIIAKSLYLKTAMRRELRELSSHEGEELNLLRTFLYKSDNQMTDPFWGDLVDALINEKKPLLTIYDPNFSVFHCKSAFNNKRRNFPYLVFLSPLHLLKLYFSLLRESSRKIQPQGDFTVNGTNLQDFIVDSYQSELLSSASLVNLAFMASFHSCIGKYNIKKAYLTFENNPWEKMFYLARQSLDKKIEVIGFQHASIPEGATNYYLSNYEAQKHLHPDKVLSVGSFTSALMKNFIHYKNIPVETGCALRHVYLERIKESDTQPRTQETHLLVVLDGTPDTKQLIQLVVDFIKLNHAKNFSIKLKEHPNLLLKNFYPEFLRQESILTNKIKLSNENLQQNLKWADIVLYTGSTSCIEALKMGKAVINYNFSLFNYDPLFQFTDLRWEIHSPNELNLTINDFVRLSPADLQQRKLAAKKFVENYFSPCTRENIERFL